MNTFEKLRETGVHFGVEFAPKSKFFVYVVVFLVPVVGALLIVLTLYLDSDLFWQNSSSQDNMWIAQKELESSSHGDIE